MAGSYDHVKYGWSLVENMGDAHETVEELLWLVLREIGDTRARELLDTEYYPMVRGEKPRDWAFVEVEAAMGR